MDYLRKMRSDVVLTIEQNLRVSSFEKNSFQENFKFFIIVGQFFGLMPIQGIWKNDVSEIKFKWLSWKVVYSCLVVFGAFVMVILYIVHCGGQGLTTNEIAPCMFYIWNFFSCWIMVRISQKWGKIIREWKNVENLMQQYGFVYNLRLKFVIISSVVLGLASAEHILFIVNGLHEARKCSTYVSYKAETYFVTVFPHVFRVINYSIPMAIFAEIVNLICTITWNYTDLFIMLICAALTSKFNQINERLKYNKDMHPTFWTEIRLDYNRLTSLTCMVDKYISPLVMVSFIDNILFLCIQLYQSLRERSSAIETLYFFYSFGFLVVRTIAVTLYGAWLYDATKLPLVYLSSVPSEYYCLEIDRLIMQISSTSIGISGCRFFILDRKFLLRMAGTIVTLELMIFQFGPVIDQSVKEKIKHCIDH